jgi:hypothetical protein
VEQKVLEDARLMVTTHEFAAGVRETDLMTRVVELVDSEKRLAERPEEVGEAPGISGW